MEQESFTAQSEVEILAGQLFDLYADARKNKIRPILDIRFRAIAAAAYVAEERGIGNWDEVLEAAMVERQSPINLKQRYTKHVRENLYKVAVGNTGLISSKTRSPENDLRALLD